MPWWAWYLIGTLSTPAAIGLLTVLIGVYFKIQSWKWAVHRKRQEAINAKVAVPIPQAYSGPKMTDGFDSRTESRRGR
jgi:hypothetical protein